jgi:hypothetical protein
VIEFICGCTSKIDPPISRDTFTTFDSVVEDAQGHLICIVHHERLKGWRSVPYSALSMRPGADPSWTPLEYERWKIFGEKPRSRKMVYTSEQVDRRDNRDPAMIGAQILAKNNGSPQ